MQKVALLSMLLLGLTWAIQPDVRMLSYNKTSAGVYKKLLQLNTMSLLDHVQERSAGECAAAWSHIFQEFQEGSEWALRMLDSWAKFPDGFLQGTNAYIGHFDECLSATEEMNLSFTAQYCPVTLLPKGGVIPPIMLGICVPSSCSLNDTLDNLNHALGNLHLASELSITDSSYGPCLLEKSKPFEAADWAFIGIIIFFTCLALLSTAYDVLQRFHRKNDKPHPVLSSFSVYTNGKFLFGTTDGPGQMTVLHGLRFFSMAWVVICHGSYFAIMGPVVNLMENITRILNTAHLPFTNGFSSVDTFFFLSGLLVCFVFFRDIGRKGSYDVPVGYLHRYIRLTPPLAIALMFQATLLSKLGGGPLWNYSTIPRYSENCKKNWWDLLLYVQNYVDPNNACLGQSWYLSADMQLYWFAPFFLYPLYLWPVGGAVWLGLVILANCWMLFGIAMENNLGPSTMLQPPGAAQDTTDYVNAYTRAIPWLVGMALGYLICVLKAKKIKVKMSPLVVLLGWMFSTSVCLSVIFSFDKFMTSVPSVGDFTTLEAAFYLPFARLGWALGLSWIVFACINGYGGPIDGFLSWKVFQPLGKLSYCVYFTSLFLQDYRLGMYRTGVFQNDFTLTYAFVADLALGYFIAIPMTLLFEIPFNNLDKYYLSNLSILPWPRPQPKPNKTKDAETGQRNEALQPDKRS